MSTYSLVTGANEISEVKQVFTSQPARLADKAPVMYITRNNDSLVAVGDRGHILKLDNAGQWQQMSTPTQALLTAVDFEQSYGWAVGHDATILHSVDNGVSWKIQKQIPELDRPLLGVNFLDQQLGFAIGAYGMFFSTQDGGKTWHKQFLDSLLPEEDIEYLAEVRKESEEDYQFEISSILPHFNKLISLSDKRLILVGELGLIAFSSDMGKTWQRIENVYEGSFFSVAQTAQGSILVGGLRGHLFRSADNGETWNKIDTPNNNSVNDIVQMANGDVLVAQNNGVVLVSKDDGQTFSQLSLLKGEDLTSINAINQQTWLAGSKGLNQLKAVK